MDYARLRRKLARWYKQNARDLPWRQTRDPYPIWLSEIMLQQTRVAAVIPYYKRFLDRFPAVEDLAAAPEEDVLTNWAGLGYYTRARNLQKAAREIVALGGFPNDYASIRALPGIGDYTAAAVASIAFGLPYAVVDGNVRRVVMRLAGTADVDVAAEADGLLNRRDPSSSNQAIMELGALVCTPKQPQCTTCPLRSDCRALAEGRVTELPPPKKKLDPIRKDRTLLLIRRDQKLLLVPSPRVNGFWELPEPFPGIRLGALIGHFRHSITNSRYRFEIREAKLARHASNAKALPHGGQWWDEATVEEIPLSTAAKKALRCLKQASA